MGAKFVRPPGYIYFTAALFLGGLLLFLFHNSIRQFGIEAFDLLSNRGRIENFISNFGWAAPPVFMGIQILQVILAPIPGEATGFIGGYLFGSFSGFIYSSIALAVGSWINFSLGRIVGERYVRKMISPAKFDKFDRLVRRQGVIVIFILYIFPGFPKDWLCLFLGITTLPIKFFLIAASIGRMPGTLVLSLQGELLFEKNYTSLIIFMAFSLLIAGCTYLYRDKLYCWVERSNHPKKP
jgi:uncharacterized membrane protein YdjX (TVP38/TMEM64 family)